MATSPAVAESDLCATRILRNLEQMSPVVTQSLQGPMRDVVLAAMAACFTEGSLFGAQQIRNAIYERENLEQQRREDYRRTAEAFDGAI